MPPTSKTAFPQRQQSGGANHMTPVRYQNGTSTAYTNNNGNYMPNVKSVTAPVPPVKPQYVIQNGLNGNQMVGTEIFFVLFFISFFMFD